MNRLTIRKSDGAWDVPLRNDDGAYIPSQEIIDRLAAYEDSGLEPEGVAALMSHPDHAYAHYVKEMWHENGGMERMEKLAKAEAEGRLLVLPCKVGDVVFYHFQFKNKRILPFTRKAKVKRIYCKRNSFDVDVELMDAKESGIMKTFHADDFGKTVFLTRADAENALEGMNNDER